jgi:plasmid stabilization system protein ParE
MKVIWSKNAEITFEAIVDNVENDFGKVVAKKFVSKTDKIILTLAIFPHVFKKSTFKENVRKATINKQCSFYYEINKTEILLLYFWNNRQEPLY